MALQRPRLLVTKGTRTPPWPRPTSLLPLLGQHRRTQSAQPELAPAARITCSRSQPRWKLTAYTTLPQGLHTAALQLPAPPKPLQTLGDAKHPNSSKGRRSERMAERIASASRGHERGPLGQRGGLQALVDVCSSSRVLPQPSSACRAHRGASSP